MHIIHILGCFQMNGGHSPMEETEEHQLLRVAASVQHVDERVRALQDRVWSVCWHPSGAPLLTSCGEDRTIKVWKWTDADGVPVGANCCDKEVEKTDKARLELLCALRGDQTRSIRCVCFSPCGRYLASASFDATILVYEHQGTDFEEVHRLEGHENEVKCCAFSRSGDHLATCSRDKSVWVWQVEDGGEDYEVGSILQQHTADVKFVVWHPREDLLVSGGYDCSIRFYAFDGDDWCTACAIKDAHGETVWDGAFEPTEGALLATVGADRAVNVWRRRNGEGAAEGAQLEQQWEKMAAHQLADSTKWPLYTVAWSSRGTLAVGGGDCHVRLFRMDTEMGALVVVGLLRMEAEVNCVSWRPAQRKGSENETDEQLDDGEECSRRQRQLLAVATDSGQMHVLEVRTNGAC